MTGFVATGDPDRDVESLLSLEAEGQLPEVVPFWGHEAGAEHPGRWVLSQWWPVPFEVDGVRYRHAEAFMMAEKARLFGDEVTRRKILEVEHPGEAKNLGRAVVDFDEAVWAAHRFGIVVAANAAKFSQHPELAGYLASTRGSVLVEASPRDRIWGVGLAAGDRGIAAPSMWRGENLLGFALMAVRDVHLSREGDER